jgi:hypothetical protein
VRNAAAVINDGSDNAEHKGLLQDVAAVVAELDEGDSIEVRAFLVQMWKSLNFYISAY